MAVEGLEQSLLFNSAILVLNLPGQPMTIYDKNKNLTTKQMADVYDRLIFQSIEKMGVSLDQLDLTFLSFGFGAFIAATLAINLGKESDLIRRFVSFNGIFKVDAKICLAFQQLAVALQSANSSVHSKLLDIANNRNSRSFKIGKKAPTTCHLQRQ